MLFCSCEVDGRDKSFCFKSCPKAQASAMQMRQIYENIKTFKNALKTTTEPDARAFVQKCLHQDREALREALKCYSTRQGFLQLVWAEAEMRAAARGKVFKLPYGHLSAVLRHGAPAPAAKDSAQGELGL